MDADAVNAVAIDPELRAALAVVGGVFPPTVTPELIPFMRRSYASPPREELFAGRGLHVEELQFPGYGGAMLEASLVSRADARGPSGAVYLLHSGGMMFGDRFSGADLALSWVQALG